MMRKKLLLILILLLGFLICIVSCVKVNELLKYGTAHDMKDIFTSENLNEEIDNNNKQENYYAEYSRIMEGLGINEVQLLENVLYGEVSDIFYEQATYVEFNDFYVASEKLKDVIYRMGRIVNNVLKALTIIEKKLEEERKRNENVEERKMSDQLANLFSIVHKTTEKTLKILNMNRPRELDLNFFIKTKNDASITAGNLKKAIFSLMNIFNFVACKDENLNVNTAILLSLYGIIISAASVIVAASSVAVDVKDTDKGFLKLENAIDLSNCAENLSEELKKHMTAGEISITSTSPIIEKSSGGNVQQIITNEILQAVIESSILGAKSAYYGSDATLKGYPPKAALSLLYAITTINAGMIAALIAIAPLSNMVSISLSYIINGFSVGHTELISRFGYLVLHRIYQEKDIGASSAVEVTVAVDDLMQLTKSASEVAKTSDTIKNVSSIKEKILEHQKNALNEYEGIMDNYKNNLVDTVYFAVLLKLVRNAVRGNGMSNGNLFINDFGHKSYMTCEETLMTIKEVVQEQEQFYNSSNLLKEIILNSFMIPVSVGIFSSKWRQFKSSSQTVTHIVDTLEEKNIKDEVDNQSVGQYRNLLKNIVKLRALFLLLYGTYGLMERGSGFASNIPKLHFSIFSNFLKEELAKQLKILQESKCTLLLVE